MMEQEGTAGSLVESGTNRMLSLSDGVFAFAMTLLVLGLNIPNPKEVPEPLLARQVLTQWPSFMVWAISFFVTGSFWLGHHRVFSLLRVHDDGLAWLNLLLLLSVTFLPFPTALLGRYSESRFAVIFYAGSLFFAATVWSSIEFYILTHRRLLKQGITAATLRRNLRRTAAMQLVCLLSIGISFLTVTWAPLSWALIPVAQRIATKR